MTFVRYQILALTRFGSASSALGRLFTDAVASNSLSSSRIAAARARSSSGDGGIGIADMLNRLPLLLRSRACEATPGDVTKAQVFDSHSVEHATQATLMAADEERQGQSKGEGEKKKKTRRD